MIIKNGFNKSEIPQIHDSVVNYLEFDGSDFCLHVKYELNKIYKFKFFDIKKYRFNNISDIFYVNEFLVWDIKSVSKLETIYQNGFWRKLLNDGSNISQIDDESQKLEALFSDYLAIDISGGFNDSINFICKTIEY